MTSAKGGIDGHAMGRRRFLGLMLGGTLGGGLAAVGGYTYVSRIEPRWLRVERVRVPIAGLPEALEGFTIALISDLHLYPYTRLEEIEAAVEVANALRPDLVVLGGDYVLETAHAIDDLAPALARLDARHGIAACVGNHDLWTDVDRVVAGLEREGIDVLRNASRTVVHEGARLTLAGLDDGWSGRPDLDLALDGVAPGTTVVLLNHEPDLADRYAHDGRVALQLSGHTHGGQVRLPGLGAPVLPKYGAKYVAGLYRTGELWVYATRGVGVIGPPVRFGCRPEVTHLTLTRSLAAAALKTGCSQRKVAGVLAPPA